MREAKTRNQQDAQPVRAGGGAFRESPQAAQLEAMAEASPHGRNLSRMHSLIQNSPLAAAQMKKIGALFGNAIQRTEEEEDPLQGKFEVASFAQLKAETAKPNNTGLPDNLKSGIESLSGISMDNVKVHYNSSQPAQLNALAYAQGTDIYVAPGQERHLPHEAWHVVQQAQGRVQPTMHMKSGVPVNDDKPLEHEADVMGAKAISSETQIQARGKRNTETFANAEGRAETSIGQPIQRKRDVGEDELPPSAYQAFIGKNKPEDMKFSAYAEQQYRANAERASKIIVSIIANYEKSTPVSNQANYKQPNPEEWDVSPALGSLIRGYGVKIVYDHKTFMFSGDKKVSYQSVIKRDPDTKKVELVAAANYAPSASQKSSSEDPHVKMNLNQIWASQIAYFYQLEQKDTKYKMAGERNTKLQKIIRSKIENWSSLATYWITDTFGSGGKVADAKDWLALSGSPNGSALLYLILENPELGEPLDAKTIKSDPTSLYDINVEHDGPNFVFY